MYFAVNLVQLWKQYLHTVSTLYTQSVLQFVRKELLALLDVIGNDNMFFS